MNIKGLIMFLFVTIFTHLIILKTMLYKAKTEKFMIVNGVSGKRMGKVNLDNELEKDFRRQAILRPASDELYAGIEDGYELERPSIDQKKMQDELMNFVDTTMDDIDESMEVSQETSLTNTYGMSLMGEPIKGITNKVKLGQDYNQGFLDTFEPGELKYAEF